MADEASSIDHAALETDGEVTQAAAEPKKNYREQIFNRQTFEGGTPVENMILALSDEIDFSDKRQEKQTLKNGERAGQSLSVKGERSSQEVPSPKEIQAEIAKFTETRSPDEYFTENGWDFLEQHAQIKNGFSCEAENGSADTEI